VTLPIQFPAWDQKKVGDMTPDEQWELYTSLIDDQESGVLLDEKDLNALITLLQKHKRRARHHKNGIYLTCRVLGNLVGRHENTIRREFEKEKDGVKKKTFSGKNRKAYTTLLISRAAAKRHYPDLDI
jgi:hypothetical protein